MAPWRKRMKSLAAQLLVKLRLKLDPLSAVLQIRRLEAEYSLRAFLVSCEVAFDFLHWFSHQNLLRQKEILGLPQKVLSEVQLRPSRIQFLRVWLLCRAPLQICRSGILSHVA